MNIQFRITASRLSALHSDLSRPHPFAMERVAFLWCQPANLPDGALLLLAQKTHSIPNEHYEPDDSVGAMLNGHAFRAALQFAYANAVSVFHVHRHDHHGTPQFSDIDIREANRFVPDFWKVRPGFPHGTLVLSFDSLCGLVWYPGFDQPRWIKRFSIVGTSVRIISSATEES